MPDRQLSAPENCLFVYGTLRRGCRPPGSAALSFLLEFQLRLIGPATTSGHLYRVGDYPGLVPGEDPQAQVHGELYALQGPPSVWQQLDEYEGCTMAFPAPWEFCRRLIEVTLADGTVHRAWCYLYEWPTDPSCLIASGDFTKR